MEFIKSNNLKELTHDEATAINGGESLWYWIAYSGGAVIRGFEAFMDGAHYASTTMPGLK